MSEVTTSALSWAAFDFADIDAKLAVLVCLMESSSSDVPACELAADRLTKIRYALGATLRSVQAPIADAVG